MGLRKMLVVGLTIMALVSVASADSITWGSDGSGTIVDRFGTAISAGAPSFVISMYNVTQGAFTGITTDFTTVGGGYFYSNPTWPTATNPYNISIGDTVYTRVDANDGWYVIVPGSTRTVGDYTVPPGQGWSYEDVGGCSSGDWVLPEPGTWALFGLGFVTLVAARKRKASRC